MSVMEAIKICDLSVQFTTLTPWDIFYQRWHVLKKYRVSIIKVPLFMAAYNSIEKCEVLMVT